MQPACKQAQWVCSREEEPLKEDLVSGLRLFTPERNSWRGSACGGNVKIKKDPKWQTQNSLLLFVMKQEIWNMKPTSPKKEETS